MRLDDLCEEFALLNFPTLTDTDHPDRRTVEAARSRVASAVVDDDFLLDCMSREVESIEQHRPRFGLQPFFVLPDRGIRFAFGHWAPGTGPGPHEHTAWTITAVCRNTLEVTTFAFDESYRQQTLVPKNCFHATAGKAGYIFEPGIHAPKNTSSAWSLSLHITSPRDGDRPSGYEAPLPQFAERRQRRNASASLTRFPYGSVLRARQEAELVNHLVHVLSAMSGESVERLLQRLWNLSTSATKRWVETLAGFRSALPPPQTFSRTHKDLVLDYRTEAGVVILRALTPAGLVDEVSISNIASAAIMHIVKYPSFDIDDLPGDLTGDERAALVNVLETSGLVTGVPS